MGSPGVFDTGHKRTSPTESPPSALTSPGSIPSSRPEVPLEYATGLGPDSQDLPRIGLQEFDQHVFDRCYASPRHPNSSTIIPPEPAEFKGHYLLPLLTKDEARRLTYLWHYTGSIREDKELLSQLQNMVDVAQSITQHDCAAISLIDLEDHIPLVVANCPLAVIPRRESVCAHTITQGPGATLVLPNMLDDWRFKCSPSVLKGLRSYAGIQLRSQPPRAGVEVIFGTLSVGSYTPKHALTPNETTMLKQLAEAVVHMIVERAALHRTSMREQMLGKLRESLLESKPTDMIPRRLDILRECYPECHVSFQVQRDSNIHLRGNAKLSYASIRRSLWEATDTICDTIVGYDRVAVARRCSSDQTLRAIVVEVASMDKTYLVVETGDRKIIFDDIDAAFVRECAMSITNTLVARQFEVALAAKEKFLQGMTHELRTPIHAIVASAELLMEESRSTSGRSSDAEMPSHPLASDQVSIIHSQGYRLLAMVNNLIDSDRIGNLDPRDLVKSMHNLSAVEEEAVEWIMQSAMYTGRNGNVSIFMDNELPSAVEELRTNATMLGRVLQSLFLNALSSTEKGSIVLRTSLAPDSTYLDYDIIDTGTGVVPDNWAHDVAPSEDVETIGSGDDEGVERSLPMAARIANSLDGTLTLISCSPDQGSWFRLRLNHPKPQSEKNHNNVRCRVQGGVMPLTYFMPGQEESLPPLLTYAARNLDGLGFIKTTKDDATIAVLADPVGSDLVQRCTHEWQIVLVISDPAYRSGDQAAHHPRVIHCSAPTVRAQLWTALSAALDIYLRDGFHDERMRLAPVSDSRRPKSPSPGRSTIKREHSSVRVLIVDDNEINVRILETFSKKRSYAYATAQDGLEALDQFEEALHHTPSKLFTLVLMDLQMPRMDGVEATRRIRLIERDNELEPCLIYMVSGQSSNKDKIRSLEAGANGYYVKPFSIQSLDDLIKWQFDA